jgi:hypothetical protein
MKTFQDLSCWHPAENLLMQVRVFGAADFYLPFTRVFNAAQKVTRYYMFQTRREWIGH